MPATTIINGVSYFGATVLIDKSAGKDGQSDTIVSVPEVIQTEGFAGSANAAGAGVRHDA